MNDLKALMLGPPRLSLAIAESITCGRLQALVGMISGASDFFSGGITAYSIEQKARHLGVDAASAKAVNGVSATIAEQMARGACELFDSDVGIATTGYAEAFPGRGVTRPFAWWAVAYRKAKGRFDFRSGRVDCHSAGRIDAQAEVAEAAYAALVDWVAGLRRG